jgi:tyrosyl-tRNA synthetase
MIAVIGGATGIVGDPSGRSSERSLLDDATLAANYAAIHAQVARFVSADAQMVNNRDWFQVSYLDFLRDVGKHITVNYMLAKESVRARLEDRDQGISYTEFSYMLLQAYDFVHLARTHGCRLQIGGSDQWGNIVTGIELGRKMGGCPDMYGLVTPLLLDSQGVKFGKSTGGGKVWLDPALTSPYQFYQFWLNTADADVMKYLRMFSFIPLDELAAIETEHAGDLAKRTAQRRLAEDVTRWVHGEDAARRAIAASRVMFGGALDGLGDADLEPLLADVPSSELSRAELDAGVPLVDLLARVKLADSKGAARRLVQQGGVYVNNVRVGDAGRAIGAGDLATESMLVLRAGKKDYHVIRVV